MHVRELTLHTQGRRSQWLNLTCLANTQDHSWALGCPLALPHLGPSGSHEGSCTMIPIRSQRHGTFKKSSGEEPGRFLYQKPEALNQTKDSLQWAVVSQVDGTKGYTIWHTEVSSAIRIDEEVMERQERRKSRDIFVSGVIFFLFKFISFCCCSCICLPAC